MLHYSLALSKLSCSPPSELEEGVIAIDAESQKAKERRSTEWRDPVITTDNGRINGRGQIEEGPEATEDKLDKEPRDDVELLADVHQIKE